MRPGLRGLLNPYISEAFFSDFVVLVEGEEDKAVLESILARHPEWSQLSPRAFVITPVGGKKNLEKLAVVLQQLRVPHFVVFDRDGEGGEVEADVARTNVALQNVIGIADPEPMPNTQTWQASAVFAPCLTEVVKIEIGHDAWFGYRDQACEESGIEVRRHIEKNSEIVRRMLELAEADGRQSTSLTECADAIVRAVQSAYPHAAADLQD